MLSAFFEYSMSSEEPYNDVIDLWFSLAAFFDSLSYILNHFHGFLVRWIVIESVDIFLVRDLVTLKTFHEIDTIFLCGLEVTQRWHQYTFLVLLENLVEVGHAEVYGQRFILHEVSRLQLVVHIQRFHHIYQFYF